MAVVGLGCVFPGATNIRDYWGNIYQQKDLLGHIPRERWDVKQFYDQDRFKRDRVYAQIGSFIDEVVFDPTKYGIPPISLKHIEPIQLLALEVADQALNDAGYSHSNFPREQTSVIFAAAGLHDLGISYAFRTGIRQHLFECKSLDSTTRDEVLKELESRLPEWSEDSFAGFLLNVVAGRIANRFNLQGSNFTVDAACASSLAAVQTAVEQLRNRSCDAVLVGAVDGTNNPFTYMSFAKTQALSPEGRSRSLDSDADGIGLGEGVGAIVLKRLSDAEESGDKIYAILRGVGSSSDGRHRSMTAPYAKGQLRALQRAYRDAGVTPDTVSLLELHSTGTQVGDQVEIEALTSLFHQHHALPDSCAVGSIKSMIGHTKTAAGMASLIKVALSLDQRLIPPTCGVKQPIDLIADSESPFYVSTETQPWLLDSGVSKRRAGISCFGFGGTNFHTVLEEYAESSDSTELLPRDVEIFCWSRSSHAELDAQLRMIGKAIDEFGDNCSIAQLANSSWIDEQSRSLVSSAQNHCRLAIVATDMHQLRRQIQWFLENSLPGKSIESPTGLYYSEDGFVDSSNICFLFPGQGSQKLNMLKPLVMRHQRSSETLETASRIATEKLGRSLSKLIYPCPTFSDQTKQTQIQTLNQTRHAQPALAAIELFALDLLQSYGINANWFAGHSFGEYTALHAAGVLDAASLLRIAVARGEACWQCQVAEPGAMAAVFAESNHVDRLLRQASVDVSIANINSDQQVVIAGRQEQIGLAVARLNERKIRATQIPVMAAFHTSAMSDAQDFLSSEMNQTVFRKPQHKVYSNTTAEPFSEETDSIRELLNRQLTEPVRFQQQIINMHNAGARVFVEVGPGRVLTGLIQQILGPSVAAYSIDSDGDGVANFARTLAQLHVVGVSTKLNRWFEHRQLHGISVRDYFQQLREQSTRKPTDWLVNSWRSRPYLEKGQTKVASHEVSPSRTPKLRSEVKGESDLFTENVQQVEAEEIRVNPPSKPTKMRSVRDLVEQASKSRLEADKTASSFDSSIHLPEVDSHMNHREPERRQKAKSNERPAAPPSNLALPQGPLQQIQASMQKWLDLQAENQKAQARFLEIQSELLNAIQATGQLTEATDSAALERLGEVGSSTHGEELKAGTTNHDTFVADNNGIADIPSSEYRNHTSEADLRNGKTEEAANYKNDIENVQNHNGWKPEAHGDARHSTSIQSGGDFGNESFPDGQSSQNGKPAISEFRQDLLNAISERTGYPIDMLDETLDLEGGLGIDSIKMVEIFSSLTKYHDYLPGADHQEDRLANFANQKTIQDIIRFYESMAASVETSIDSTGSDDFGSRKSVTGAVEHLILEEFPAETDSKKKKFPKTI